MSEIVRPSILFVTAHCPLGPVYGAQLRTLHLARILKGFGDLGMLIFPFAPISEDALQRTESEFTVRGVFGLNDPTNASIGARLRREFDPYSADTENKRLSPEDERRVLEIADEYDLIWFQGISIPNCLGRKRWPNAVLDIDDVPSQCFAGKVREAKDLPARLRAIRKASQWKRRERVFLDRFGSIGVCSEDDRRYFGGGERVHVIPNGFAAPEVPNLGAPVDPPRIGFIGTLNYAPNLDGVRWFIDRVWPLIRKTRPDARLRLVGAATDSGIAGSGERIDGLGFVDDSQAEISTWSLTVVPILVGGGTRIKIAEAFSRKCPVVSTGQGAYGYDIESGKECLLADSPAEMADACLRLLADPDLAIRMAETAWAAYQAKWSWEAIAPRVAAAFESCLALNSTSKT